MRRKSRNRLVVILVIVVVLAAACLIYLGDYYKVDEHAVAAFAPAESVTVKAHGGLWTYSSGNGEVAPEVGLIFYPGGKVDHLAYAPLMEELASEGILCVLVEMPFHLAVFDPDAAEGIQPQYPEISKWYIGGHSLGGAMAGTYLSKTEEEFQGLILLGSYSTADLSASGLEVLSVYGSQDRVMDRQAYAENLGNLPGDFTEVVLEGGCHAGFGLYGPQKGDGIPTISSEEQIRQTSGILAEFMK
ncbi:MAG: alpha/beta hydrolase [Firmicutes bacterium]|nr:alpha/beta hydrolase [Bacillota bacterium]